MEEEVKPDLLGAERKPLCSVRAILKAPLPFSVTPVGNGSPRS